MGVDSRTAIFGATSQPGAAPAWGVQEDQQMVIWNHIQRTESSRRRGSQTQGLLRSGGQVGTIPSRGVAQPGSPAGTEPVGAAFFLLRTRNSEIFT